MCRVTASPLVFLAFAALTAGAATVEFNRDIRPILSDRCFSCHGPDEKNRLSKLRFDSEAGARQNLGGRYAIVPKNPAKSVMLDRITTTNKGLRMPPVHAGPALAEREIALIRKWIEEGAPWEKHWSFIAPKRPLLPRVSDPGWVRSEIDRFILARLDREGLKPSAEAPKTTLIRRVSFDLTGLPPTPTEVEAFLRDESSQAYEKVVDRLLSSPRYGERMASRWLDAARYADTNGYQTDAERFMWRWRDWVIEAFNRNMPFDRFTIEQLAGDLLDAPTLDQRIATGFNRNHRGNGEGGSIAAEFAVEYVVDRVDTTSTVWLGLAMGCARCHDHKYDPISQKEFYQVYAFFNNIPEKGKVFKYGNSPPLIPAPTHEQETELRELERKHAEAQRAFLEMKPRLEQEQAAWERSIAGKHGAQWSPATDLIARYPLDGTLPGADRAGKPLKAEMRGGAAVYAPGPLGQAAVFDGTSHIDAGNLAPFGFYSKFSLAAWVYPDEAGGAIVTRAQEVEEASGYGLYLKDGKVQVNLISRWLDDCLRVETRQRIENHRWQHVAMSYDGSRVADGIRVYIDGKPAPLDYIVDDLNQNFQTREPLRIGAGNGSRFQGRISDVRVFNGVLSPVEMAILAGTKGLGELAAIAAPARTPSQSATLERAFLEQYGPDPVRAAWQRLEQSRRAVIQFKESVQTVMVMQERTTPADTHILLRGAYDRPGPKVTRAVPAVFPPMPSGAPANRLGFARWLVQPSNPLPARVTVNRFWQMLFGTGIVKTVEDFGSQGEWPTHPELLDWLAAEFVRTGWDMKAILKTVVMSATYRQSSKTTPALIQRDPENRLLARAPRFRLAPEMVRDQALALSGLLVEKLGGPSVKPYQPAGLWRELSGGADYQRDSGDKLYRRGLYTFWKRAAPPPGLMTFDSAGREACTVRETRTNTPLQALTLMNDETYLEAARKLAERMMLEGGASPAERLSFGHKLALARPPGDRERGVLVASYHHHLDRYQTSPKDAERFLDQGESDRDTRLDPKELAAYATVASLILNLDELVTKE